MIPYGKQDISQADIDAVIEVLQSDFLTQGPSVERFELALSHYTGAKHTVAVNSATSALHLACLALGVSSGDLVWTSPITFVASANCALYCGADIDFVDIEMLSNNMSIVALREKLQQAKELGRLPKVVIPVHMAGLSCDMKAIFELSLEYGFKIIEDASHAVGGSLSGNKVGSCEFSDISVFSFHPVKIITTGEGGAALTNDANLGRKLALLRSHGVTRDANEMEHGLEGGWYYEQISLGYNYRMTDLQAALGCSQLTRIDEFVSKRNKLASEYHVKLADLSIDLPVIPSHTLSAYHLYIVKLLHDHPLGRRKLYDHLRSRGIGVNVHYIPVHLQPFYRSMGFSPGDFPEAEKYYRNAISIPLHPNLSEKDQDVVVNSIREFMS
jgi:UDP-4-amino-4,6-dideoxy-N-acetyl-beta-L-altrosamine transaminase